MSEGNKVFESEAVSVVTPTQAAKIQTGELKSKPLSGPKKSVIRPVSGSRMLSRVANVVDHYIEGKDEAGNEVTEKLGTYNKERFPDSRQNFRPEFDGKLGQFDIRKKDGTLWTQEDADKCLKAFPLAYPEGHTKANEPITSCDIHNVADAYFISIGLMRYAEEGELALSWGITRDELLMQMYAGMEEVAMDDGQEFHPGDTRYLITDPDAQDDKVERKMNVKLDATKLFLGMQDDRQQMLDILSLFSVFPEEDQSMIAIRLELFKYVDDNTTTEDGATYQQRFITYGQFDKTELSLRASIAKGMASGDIRSRAGSYWFADESVGKMYAQVVEHFRKHNSDLDTLKSMLKKK